MVFGFICAVSMDKIFRVLIIMLFCLIVFSLTEKSIPLEIRDQLFILLKLLLSSGLLVSLV